MKYPSEKQIRLSAGSFAFVALALSSRIAVADQAVLVAVQKYPNLDSRANQLKGCLNDATAMKAVLEQRGFQVTLLTNEKATKQGILDALEAARKSAKPNEEFVFYFSGHGTNSDGDSSVWGVMPSNITTKTGATGFRSVLITHEELYEFLRIIPAKHCIAILESSYSGGMAVEAHLRVFNSPSMGKIETKVGYLTASQQNQKAYELDDIGETHGAFTYFLLQQVKDKGTKKSWGDIFSDIKKKIELEKPDMQIPVMSSWLAEQVPFSN